MITRVTFWISDIVLKDSHLHFHLSFWPYIWCCHGEFYSRPLYLITLYHSSCNHIHYHIIFHIIFHWMFTRTSNICKCEGISLELISKSVLNFLLSFLTNSVRWLLYEHWMRSLHANVYSPKEHFVIQGLFKGQNIRWLPQEIIVNWKKAGVGLIFRYVW